MKARRIKLIVTGDLERQAMVPSLSRLFPESVGRRPVEWLRPQKSHGATSHRLIADKAPSNPMRDLARAALTELLYGADGTPADLVVVLDDLELDNLDQPEVVCAHFTRAMAAELDALPDDPGRQPTARDRVREACSFHLIAPMAESYLFGDHAALVRVGCAPDVEPVLADPDVERFESADEGWRPEWQATNARHHAEPQPRPWWREQCHPKHYLEHLVARNDRIYDEVPGGADAFAQLDWPQIPHDTQAAAFARALFEDLALFFDVTNPLGHGAASPMTWPVKAIDRRTLTLRNM